MPCKRPSPQLICLGQERLVESASAAVYSVYQIPRNSRVKCTIQRYVHCSYLIQSLPFCRIEDVCKRNPLRYVLCANGRNPMRKTLESVHAPNKIVSRGSSHRSISWQSSGVKTSKVKRQSIHKRSVQAWRNIRWQGQARLGTFLQLAGTFHV